MDILSNSFNWLFSNTVPFIVLLGVLIFVHELGHFLVAKYFGVRVEVFSLGFGKKILQYKKGDTTYCVSLIPLGGYVKMFGDDPRAPIPESEKQFSFLHKPLWPRTAVVLAGPLMNFFFAIFLFAYVGILGEQNLRAMVGDLPTNSVAYQAGLRPGDEVLQVNGIKVESWKQLNDQIEDNADQSTKLLVKDESGQTKEVNVIPVLQDNQDVLSTKSKIGVVEGLINTSRSTALGIPNSSSPAKTAGLQTHDIINKVNGKEVANWRELEKVLSDNKSEKLSFEVDRYAHDLESKKTLTIETPAVALADLGIESAELYLFKIMEGTPADKAGLKANDKVIDINGNKFEHWHDILSTIKSYKEGDQPLKVTVLREGQPFQFSIAPTMTKVPGPRAQQEQRFTIGIAPTPMLEALPPVFWLKQKSMGSAFRYGWQQTIIWTKTTFAVFAKIFQSKISPRNIGGIISIQQAAKKTYDYGISVFIKMMGILSVNLFVMNLLPIPVLDGGHLFFYLIEFIKGTPLSLRKMELATQVGLFLLVGLMLFAIFNDLSMVFKLNW